MKSEYRFDYSKAKPNRFANVAMPAVVGGERPSVSQGLPGKN